MRERGIGNSLRNRISVWSPLVSNINVVTQFYVRDLSQHAEAMEPGWGGPKK